MCHLVTIGVSGYSGDLADLFRSYGLHIAPAINPHVCKAMASHRILLDVTDGGCSCSLYVDEQASSPLDESAERARYARRGWSEAKIERALESKRKSHGRSKLESKAEQWCRCVLALSKSGSKVAALVHDYDGLFAEEVVRVEAKVCMSLEDFVAGGGAIPEDALVSLE